MHYQLNQHGIMCIALTLYSMNVNASQVWLPYPILRPEENLVLEPIIRGCFADADQHWTAFQVAKTLYAFMQSQSWV